MFWIAVAEAEGLSYKGDVAPAAEQLACDGRRFAATVDDRMVDAAGSFPGLAMLALRSTALRGVKAAL